MALMTVEEYWALNAYTGEPTDGETTAINFYLKVISEAIETYCNRKFESGTFVDTFRHLRNVTSVQVAQFPVSAVTSVIVDGQALMGLVDYQLDKDSGIFYFGDSMFGVSEGIISCEEMAIIYTGGYPEIPAVIQQVVLDFVDFKYTPPSQMATDTTSSQANIKTVQIEGVGAVTYESSSNSNIGSAAAVKAGGPLLGFNYSTLDPYRDLSKTIKPYSHQISTVVETP